MFDLLDLAFDPHQPRDPRGRWVAEPGSERNLHSLVETLLKTKVKPDRGPTRVHMPQLSGTPIPGSKADKIPHAPGEEVDLTEQFQRELRAQGHKVTVEKVDIKNLKPTQDELVVPKVEGIVRYMATAPKNSPVYEPIFVSSDDHVIDGHHRWAAQVIRDEINGTPRAKMKVRKLDMPIADALAAATAFMKEWGLPTAGMNDKTTIPTFAHLSNETFDLLDLAITPGGRVGDASPLGKGPRRLSDYEREIAHALIRKGMKKRKAIRMARGLLKKAAATGRWGDHGMASPAVRAGAAASIAQRKTF